jgi:hypothetical protein
MGAEATLRPGRLPVAPGGEVQTEISVKNSGTVVDSFTFSVLGDAAHWAVCEPEAISLFPGQNGTAQIFVRPPLGSDVPHGPVPFGVRVASTEDPPGSVVEEGVLDISPLPIVAADMSPRTGRARGMRASRHRVAVDNQGNAPAVIELVGFDEADTVDVQVRPAELEVPPGSAAFAQVRVRARRRFWRGPGVTHRFQVIAHPVGGDAPVRSDGTLLQEAVLPSWLPKAIALTAAAAVAAVALWFGVLRPAVRDAATSAGTAAAQKTVRLAMQGTTGGAAAQSGTAGSGSAAAGSTPSPKASAGKTPSPKASPGSTKPGSTNGGGTKAGGTNAGGTKAGGTNAGGTNAGGAPVAAGAPAAPGSGTTQAGPAPVPFAQTLDSSNLTMTAPAKHSMALTDLVMQNPAGDQGTLTLSRGGTVLFSQQLADFREYDLHFITAIMLTAGQKFQLSLNCTNPGACTPAVLITGTTS